MNSGPRLLARVWPLVVLLAAAIGCESSAAPRPETSGVTRRVSIAAAADLQFALADVIREFEKTEPGMQITATYGSSGTFFAQLSNRAPFDLYFSADIAYPRKLVEAGHADRETELLYAIGQLVVWVRQDSPLAVEKLGLRAVLEPAVQKIAIANPQHAPYGRAALAALEHEGLAIQVRDRLVRGENVAQASQFVESGAADVGLLALSLALAPPLKSKGRYALIPQEAYPRIEQGCIVLNWAQDRDAAIRFQRFIAGKAGREILARYGFLRPQE
ncbi:MAG: molybdate ABC transporter substrate-binding protein [Planctomycetaceae bacterium]|nr:molybdate ABC transporter substrate-binding protein [Planctomycetaceae bacterium]